MHHDWFAILQMSYHNLQGTRGNNDDQPVKRIATDRRMVCLAHTWSGFSLLAMDSTGGLHFFTLMRPADVGKSLNGTYLIHGH